MCPYLILEILVFKQQLAVVLFMITYVPAKGAPLPGTCRACAAE